MRRLVQPHRTPVAALGAPHRAVQTALVEEGRGGRTWQRKFMKETTMLRVSQGGVGT